MRNISFYLSQHLPLFFNTGVLFTHLTFLAWVMVLIIENQLQNSARCEEFVTCSHSSEPFKVSKGAKSCPSMLLVVQQAIRSTRPRWKSYSFKEWDVLFWKLCCRYNLTRAQGARNGRCFWQVLGNNHRNTRTHVVATIIGRIWRERKIERRLEHRII